VSGSNWTPEDNAAWRLEHIQKSAGIDKYLTYTEYRGWRRVHELAAAIRQATTAAPRHRVLAVGLRAVVRALVWLQPRVRMRRPGHPTQGR
jgi:hypothetical protein